MGNVFVNEINYNAASPINSYVEIAAKAGESLADYHLFHYGADRTYSHQIDVGNATSTDEAQGWGFFSIPAPLIGSSGGLCVAPSGPGGPIYELTSYGLGTLPKAIGGPCFDQNFRDAGDGTGNEDGSMSMQRFGEGKTQNDFLTWAVSASTEGLINENQCFFPDGATVCAQTICRAAPTTRSLVFEDVANVRTGNLRARALNGWFPCGPNIHCVRDRATCEIDAMTNEYYCQCMDGYENGIECRPTDECQTEFPCPAGSKCVDMFPPMKYKCVCKEGSIAFLPNELPDEPGVPFSYRPVACIDKCMDFESSPCHPMAWCNTNALGNVECKCKEGLVGDGITDCTKPSTVETVTEAPAPAPAPQVDCSISTDCQGDNMQCVDNECRCLPGYVQVGPNCQNEVHCDSGGFNNDCHRRAICTEESGFPGFSCTCIEGWEDAFEDANGKSCSKIVIPPATTDPPPEPLTEEPVAAGVGPHPDRPTVFPPPEPTCLALDTNCTSAGDCCSGICT